MLLHDDSNRSTTAEAIEPLVESIKAQGAEILPIDNNTYKVLDDVLNDSIHILMKETYLQNKEIDELKKLIFTLGKSDIESQSRMIDLSIENLKKITGETKEDINQKGMVYRKLATIVGLIIGIILI